MASDDANGNKKRTPLQDAVLDILAARYRLGHPVWTLTKRFEPALRGLGSRGLVEYWGAPIEGHYLVELTEAGKKECLDPSYAPPPPSEFSKVRLQDWIDHLIDNTYPLTPTTGVERDVLRTITNAVSRPRDMVRCLRRECDHRIAVPDHRYMSDEA